MLAGYVLDRFPAISETFISDEVSSVIQAGVPCHVFSLDQPPLAIVHPRAKQVVDSGVVSYCKPKSAVSDLWDFLALAIQNPIRTVRTFTSALRDKEHKWLARSALGIARTGQRLGVTHFHAHYADTAAQLAMWAHRWTGTPFTLTTHGYDIFKTPPHNMKELVDESKGMVCISHYNLRYLVKTFGVDERKLKVIRCGIYVDEFENDTRVPALQGEPLRLLCVARLVPEKGHQYLFEAVRMLIARGVAISLNLAGGGPLRRALEDLANEMAISANVHFSGEQTGLQVRQLFRDCDIAVLASLSESMGLVNMEGMASGRPVIATAVLGVSELVEDRVTGFLCPPANPQAIVDTIQWILAHPDDTREIIERGKKRVKTEFSREECTRQLLSAWN